VEGTPLERRNKMIIGTLMIAILALSILALQQRFDQSDYEKAIRMLAVKAPGQQRSIAEELAQRAGNGPADCQPRMLSSFRGTLEVTCHTGNAEPYHFNIDLVRKTVEPADARSREFMAGLRGSADAGK
jgi:hypothetical protein